MSESTTIASDLGRVFRSAYDQIRWRHTTLEPLIEILPDARGGAPAEVELVDSLVLGGIARSGVTFLPGVAAACRVHAPPGAMISVDCGVQAPAGTSVRFTITTPQGSRQCVVASGGRWLPLAAPVEADGRGGSLIRMCAEVVSGTVTTVRPVWGAPTLRWPRSVAEIGRLMVRASRQYGLRGMWRRMRSHGAAIAADPETSYRAWLAAHTPSAKDLEQMRHESARLSPRCRFAVLVISRSGAAHSSLAESLGRQVYPYWDAWLWSCVDGDEPALAPVGGGNSGAQVLGPPIRTEAEARNAVAVQAGADLMLTLDAADELAPEALYEIAAAAIRHPDAGLFYSDEDRLLADGPGRPQFKPGWSPELLLSRMYLGRLVAMRCERIRDTGGYRPDVDGAHDYDMSLRMTSAGAAVVHIPKVLYHRAADEGAGCHASASERRALEDICRHTGRQAVVVPGGAPRTWRVRHHVPDSPRVTIVIPTDGQSGATLSGPQPFVVQCIRSIVERTAYPHVDLVVVDNGYLPADAAALLARLPHQRATYQWTGSFNFSRKINFAVAHATGDFVLLLNDDVEVINADWLSAMLEYAGQNEIGAVGAKLFYPDGRLQHVGVATGVCGIAAHLLHQHPGGSTGCGHAARAVRNCAAVTGACLLTRRAVYNQVGGFDERMAVDFNDVDFCLRVRAAGYRIVFTPYARLYHHESASFGSRVQHPRDTAAMRQIWGAALDGDPYYNPNLSRDFPDCRIAPR
ncbi:MAG TPA: glycosyltransferase family 2 protein [Vicinamibacterales bacterium]|nr:glycosyltransferase family 2 protein [Vicinamibacterales bacterium]